MTSVAVKTINFSTKEIGSKEVILTRDLESLNPKAVAYVLNWQLSKKRAGTAKVKTMDEISGTTAKPYKQKGTGRARQGSKRSVQFRGGRVSHGPVLRSFEYTIPKKIVRKVLAEVVNLKFIDNEVFVYSGSQEGIVKTSHMSKFIKDNNISSSLVVYDRNSENSLMLRSIRNLVDVKAVPYEALNVYDVMNFEFLLLDKNLLEKIKGDIS